MDRLICGAGEAGHPAPATAPPAVSPARTSGLLVVSTAVTRKACAPRRGTGSLGVMSPMGSS